MATVTTGWPDLRLLETAPILIWRAGRDAKCDWFNPAWLDYRGRVLEQELGDGWTEGVHPGDFDRCLQIYLEAFARRQRFGMEYRILRADGEYGWIVDYGMPVHDEDGAFLGYMGYCFDITERRQNAENLRRREAELRAVYDASNVAIFHIDQDGIISRANRRAHQMFDCAPGELDGANYLEFVPVEDYREVRANLDHLFADDRPLQLERLYRRRSGETFWGHLSAERVAGENGSIGLVVVVVDITEHKATEQELEKACRTLEASNAELEQFAYIASHDLREPLRMISSYTSLIERRYAPSFDRDGLEFLGYIREGAQRMDRMVLDLLDFSRIDRRGAPLEPMESAAALAASLHNLMVAIDESGAVILCNEALPRVLGDIHQITSLFQNLIGNAIKYRRPGRAPQIVVTFAQDGELWRFTVADDGIGIAAEFHERIFLLFQRLHTHQAYDGTGIGLAVCKKIVERHGGRIWLDSAPELGSAFHFTLKPAEE